VFLGWNRYGDQEKEDKRIKPVYAITLPDDAASAWKLNRESALVFSLAALDEDAPRLNENDAKKGEKENKPGAKKERESPDFTVELETADGSRASRALSDFGTILPPLKAKFTKLDFLDRLFYEKSSEPVFQTISIPLRLFTSQEGFDAERLKVIRLRFDRTASSVILLSKLGFE
jgi:hypothetical protein